MTDREIAGIHHRNIEKANHSKNPLEEIQENCSVYETKAGEKFKILCKRKAEMDPKNLKWCFKLAERNVGPYYKDSPLGWTPKEKQSCINKNWARFLLAYDSDNKLAAYSMFRFDMDYGRSVLYCYEMQVEEEHQRKGLGGFMMEALEKIGRSFGMEKLVLTLLDNNPDAKRFYDRLDFALDETDEDREGYKIFSKSLL